MAMTAIEQLVIDSESRFLEMKSLQPYSTRDEYLYAMKEDLADWLSNMYPDWRPITAETFLDCLENGVLLCHHANNVNDAARKVSSNSSLINCKYRADARPQTFNARDNVSQFIKWSRHIAGVREVLMFESDDLILRKNEKNFILCLLEIARYGAKFGFSVPAIIKLEYEIEQEIERDKQRENLSIIQLQQDIEHDKHTEHLSIIHLQHLETEQDIEHDEQIENLSIVEIQDLQTEQEMEHDKPTENLSTVELQYLQTEQEIKHDKPTENLSIVELQYFQKEQEDENRLIQINTINLLEQQIAEFTDDNNNDNIKEWQNNVESKVITTSNEELQLNHKLKDEKQQKPIVPPASSSHLHKTVVKIVNSCCCSQRFPVIQIGEGKYRIGENGTIIFIRILRNHVMVRVGGGWDTLENYLNKHDPCRRSGGHHRNEHHHHDHNSDIPILAIPNPNISLTVQKNTPFGKSVKIKTEEFPLPKPSTHDTNLVDAQLVITRGADGRHRIGQITYKSEEDTLNQQPACPHHHNHHRPSPPPSSSSSSSPTKTRTPRSSGRATPLSIFNKQSSPSTDQDYSSLTETTTHSKPSPSSSFEFKDESIEQSIKSLNITTTTEPQHYSPVRKSHVITTRLSHSNLKDNNLSITESVIGNIDPISNYVAQDFDISDIEDAIELTKKPNLDETTIDMDNDSLESSEGVLEEKKKSPTTKTKSNTGYVSAFYLAQKQKFQEEQAANRKRSITNLNRHSSRSTTLSNVINPKEQISKQRRKLIPMTKRSQSTDLIDTSKIDRDSGFDEQDFRRERLNSNGDDNSSVSSIKSARSSTIHSINFEIRQNKSYELRMKKLDAKRNSSLSTRQNLNSSTRRGSELIPPIPSTPTNKSRKNSQPVVHLKLQPQTENVNL